MSDVEEKKPDIVETVRPPSVKAPAEPPICGTGRRLFDRAFGATSHLPPLSNDTIAKFVRLIIPLTVACAAYLKPETSSRKTYDVLAHNLEEQSKAAAQNHEDIVALRNYLEGYTRHEVETGATYQVSSAIPPSAGQAPSASAAPPLVLPPNSGAKAGLVKIKRVEPPPAPPPASPAPATYVAKNYKSVTGTDDIK